MAKQVDLFYNTYANFQEQVLAEVRRETFGEDIGQNSWITASEYDKFYGWLGVDKGAHVLEVASGSGGPSLYLARQFGCQITGLDANEEGVKAANKAAADAKVENATYQLGDATQRLPFDDNTFDAVMCIDSANHFPDRLAVLKEWHRVLKPGRRVLFTDPVVITGPVTNEELAARSSIGLFVFMPLEATERFINEAGLKLVQKEDVTSNIELTSGRWHAAREKHRDDLVQFEGEENFEGVQQFFAAVHKLTSERRLSRYVFVAEK